MLIKTLAVILMLVATSASAKNLYVDGGHASCPGADTTVTYAQNDADNPWCTFGRAVWGQATYSTTGTPAQAAQAGDVVTVAPGIYTGPQTNELYICAFSPVNNGHVTNGYITFRAEHSANTATAGNRTILQTTGEYGEGEGGCVIGGAGKSYHKWIGFYIDIDDAINKQDTGPVVVWSSSYVDVEENYITATTYPIPAPILDNVTGIRLERSSYINIRNNYVSNIRGERDGFPVTGSHGAGIQGYNNQNVLVENNEVVNCNDGIYPKGMQPGQQDQTDWTVRYNLLRDNGVNILVGGIIDIDIYSNLLIGGYHNFVMVSYSDRDVPRGINFYNNTIVGSTSDCFYWGNPGTGDLSSGTNLFNDNIFSDNAAMIVFYGTASAMYASNDQILFNHNFYYNNTSHGTVNWATWTGATYGQDVNGATGSDPLFTDAANDDYTLATGSPALTASSTSGPVGAYITGDEIIGLTSGTAECSPQYRNLCDESDCETTGEGYWYNDTCNATAQGTLVNGACGSNDGATLSSLTSGSANNCSAGTVADFSGTGPWTWNCDGANGGTDDACSASLLAVGGGTGRAPYSATARVPYSATRFAPYYEEVSP